MVPGLVTHPAWAPSEEFTGAPTGDPAEDAVSGLLEFDSHATRIVAPQCIMQ